MNFALPGCRSNFSLLWGTIFPEQLVEQAGRQGIRHLGLADNDNLYAAIDFYHACRDRGINPLIGVRLTSGAGMLHLIAQDYVGYQNLCRLVTKRQLDGAITLNSLFEHRKSLYCLAPDNGDLAGLKETYGDNVYLSSDGSVTHKIQRLSKKFNLNIIANPSVSFLKPKDYELHLLLRAISAGKMVDDLGNTIHASPRDFFPNQIEVTHRFQDYPETVINGIRLTEKCQFVFPQHRNLLPEYENYDGDRTTLLRSRVIDGLLRKKSFIRGQYQARLDFELEVIERTGYVDYFLVVSDIVNHCKEIGIPAIGRGSAAGSLVSYGLDITPVDPIKEGLYFERFLNEARRDPPDIDIDIDWRRRDDVLDYIYNRYGSNRTAMIASYIRFRARLAIREVAKAHGLGPKEIDNFVKRLARTGPPGSANLKEQVGRISRENIDLQKFEPILKAALRLDNFPRHLGIHPGGIVITPGPLTDYVALERATKGIVVTQCDMYQGEKLGLVKIDILGQRGLAVIVDCYEHARKVEGESFKIPENNEKTYKMLQSGKTIGVFQIESPGLRALLRDLKPEELNDITLALSLIRPGASDSGMKKTFLDRHHGKEKTDYAHPRLEKILKETHGVFIYQEQVLLCAREIAGFNLPAADLLRRAITKGRKKTDYGKLQKRFLEGALRNGVIPKQANEIFKLLRYFAGFGFCKAHAATYAYLAYQSAYFKAHYPGIFMRAVLNNYGGYYPAPVYISEARRLGIDIHPPDINLSGKDEILVGNKMYSGLGRVRELSHKSLEQIINLRPFAAFDDFLAGVRLSATEAENLARVGAFDTIENNRPRLLWRLRLSHHKHHQFLPDENKGNAQSNDLLGGQLVIPKGQRLPRLPDFTLFEKFWQENEIIGFSASRHPLTLFPGYNGSRFSNLLESRENTPINITGWLVDIKRIKTREKKEWMVFLTFEDPDETFEVVLFPDIYREHSELIRKYRYFDIVGELNIEEGNIAIIGHKLIPAATGLDEKPYI